MGAHLAIGAQGGVAILPVPHHLGDVGSEPFVGMGIQLHHLEGLTDAALTQPVDDLVAGILKGNDGVFIPVFRRRQGGNGRLDAL